MGKERKEVEREGIGRGWEDEGRAKGRKTDNPWRTAVQTMLAPMNIYFTGKCEIPCRFGLK
jgi:hypothetical protein